MTLAYALVVIATTTMFTLAVMVTGSSCARAQSWRQLDVPTAPDRWDALSFVHPDTGWIADATRGWVRHTTDGGETWVEQVIAGPDNESQGVRSLTFLDSKRGWAGILGGQRLFQTVDGGLNWTAVAFPDSAKPGAICGLANDGVSAVWCVGAFSQAIFGTAHVTVSRDAGATWTYRAMGDVTTTLVDVVARSGQEAIVCGSAEGGPSDGKAVILRTWDGGTTWETVYKATVTGTQVWKMQFIDRDHGFASIQGVRDSAAGYYLRTTDGGASWEERPIVLPQGVSPLTIQAIGFRTLDHGVVGGRGVRGTTTTDGGVSWGYDSSLVNLNRLQFFGDSIGYASGRHVWKFTLKGTSVSDGRTAEAIPPTFTWMVDGDEAVVRYPDHHHAATAQIYDVRGRVVRDLGRPTSHGQYRFSLHDLPTGALYLVITTTTDHLAGRIPAR